MGFKKFLLAVCLCFSIARPALSTLPENSEISCPKAITEVVDDEIQAIVSKTWWGYRNKLKSKLEKLKPEIMKELEIQCAVACSSEEKVDAVARAIQTVVGQAGGHSGPGLRGYAYFIGAIGVQAGLTILYTTQFDKVTAVSLAAITNGVLGILVAGFGSAVTERLANLATKASYATASGSRHAMEKLYERIAYRSRGVLSNVGQAGRAMYRGAIGTTMIPVLSACRYEFSLNGDKAVGPAGIMMARLIFDLMQNYGEEIDLTDDDPSGWAQDMVGGQYITKENFPAMLTAILDHLKKVDKLYAERQDYYKRLVSYWLYPRG